MDDFEFDLHGQGVDLGFGELGQLGGGGFALGGEGGGGFSIFGRGGFEGGAKGFEDFVAVFDFGKLLGYVGAEGYDFVDGLAVFALEAVDEGEAVFDFGEALGGGVDAFGVVAEGGGDVADGGAGGGELLDGFSEARVEAGELFDVAQGGAEGDFGRGSAFVELVEGSVGGGVELFSVGEDALFGFEGFVFAGLEVGGLDFLALVAPEIDHAEAVLLALEEVVELVLGGVPVGVGGGDGVEGDAGEAVEEDALLGLVEAGVGLGLGVDEGQFWGELLEDGDGGGLVVDEDAALAGGEDLAAEDDVVAFRVDAVLFQDGFGAGGGLEDAGDDGFFRAVAYNFRGRLATHKQGERIYQYGFACAGFAGEEVEAGAELGDGVIDDGVIFSAQFDEHPGNDLSKTGCGLMGPPCEKTR